MASYNRCPARLSKGLCPAGLNDMSSRAEQLVCLAGLSKLGPVSRRGEQRPVQQG